MIEYTSKRIVCPHCGHHTRVELDASQGDQEFYEDCMACCNRRWIGLQQAMQSS